MIASAVLENRGNLIKETRGRFGPSAGSVISLLTTVCEALIEEDTGISHMYMVAWRAWRHDTNGPLVELCRVRPIIHKSLPKVHNNEDGAASRTPGGEQTKSTGKQQR